MEGADRLPRGMTKHLRSKKGAKAYSRLINSLNTPDGTNPKVAKAKKQWNEEKSIKWLEKRREEKRIKFDVEEQPFGRCLRYYSRKNKLMPSAKICYNYLLAMGYSEPTSFQMSRAYMSLFRHLRKISKGASQQDSVKEWFRRIYKNLTIMEPVPGRVELRFHGEGGKVWKTPLDQSDKSNPPEDNGPPGAEEDDDESGASADEGPPPRQGFMRNRFASSAAGSARNPSLNPGYCPPGAVGSGFGSGPFGANFADERPRPQHQGLLGDRPAWSAPDFSNNPGYWPDRMNQPYFANGGFPMNPGHFPGPAPPQFASRFLDGPRYNYPY